MEYGKLDSNKVVEELDLDRLSSVSDLFTHYGCLNSDIWEAGTTIPPEMICIAGTPGQSLILLCVSGKNYGKVYFWNYYNIDDFSDDVTINYDNIGRIANSFYEFIECLRPWSEAP